jgi:hypothetical protein
MDDAIASDNANWQPVAVAVTETGGGEVQQSTASHLNADTASPARPYNSASATATALHTTITGRCTQYEPLLAQLAPKGGWSVVRMSRLMWRESRCTPTAIHHNRNGSIDSGALQVNSITYQYLRKSLGERVDRWSLQDITQNIRAAAALCTYWRTAGRSCYRPWGGRG